MQQIGEEKRMEVQVDDLNLREWGLRSRRISRENTKSSRRFSASNLKSFREEEAASFRSIVSVSSTASSPGYTAVREEIDPSTYSFTSALRALQAKTWEMQPRDGLTLNSKWNEAEKYICNPLSGEVPLECLSAKTLSGRSFRGLATRITMSAPLIYPSQIQMQQHYNPNPNPIITATEQKKMGDGMKTRDVGTQSTPIDLSSSSRSRSRSPSPAPTPSIQEKPIKMMSDADFSSVSFKSDSQVEAEERRDGGERKNQWGMGCYCVSLRGLWMRTQRQKEKHKTRTNNTTFLHHLNASKQSS